ncbi:MAG TPA: 2-amino-4-hydroxy-6-hydroxymethyldihydropteridine diphosphokinase [Streptosporangiaceae bacterium]|nr:2-amino-4-hydroxy-6-hydroxymethyldihydropteridine diphosphokinase [Streptosporangiaceae bacterium]
MTRRDSSCAATRGDNAGYDRVGGVRAIVFSLGSNVGDRLANLQLGVEVLGGDLDLQAVSSVYETDPVGGVDQADYLNAVLLARSSLPPRDILARCAAAEAAAGRVRRQRWGPRTLDVDVIVCGSVVSADPTLTLPHPRAHERAFVLVPWLELDVHAVLPGWGPVAGLLRALPAVPDSTGPDSKGPRSTGPRSTGPDSIGTVRRRPELRLTLPAPEADAPCS